jgi:hypothetical protein
MATRDSPGTTPRLRFDKVARRLVQGVRGSLEGAVPDGLCVMFAVTAPVREPSKTLTALIETVRARLRLGAGMGEHAEAIHGNEIRVRVVTSRLPNAARVAGFVHNPDPPPSGLLDMAQSLLECVEAPDVARRLGAVPNLETLRHVCEQLLDIDRCANVIAAVGQQSARATHD